MARTTAVRKSVARSMKKIAWSPLQPIKPSERGLKLPPFATRAFSNNRFVVLINDKAPTSAGSATVALVVPNNAGRDVFWRDLQKVKNEIFGEEAVAIQYYPAESKLIDEANVYWLYVYPSGVIPEPTR